MSHLYESNIRNSSHYSRDFFSQFISHIIIEYRHIQRVMYYIDTGHTDMRQLAFDIVKGLDRPGWKDVSSVDEIEISRASGMNRKVFIRL